MDQALTPEQRIYDAFLERLGRSPDFDVAVVQRLGELLGSGALRNPQDVLRAMEPHHEGPE